MHSFFTPATLHRFSTNSLSKFLLKVPWEAVGLYAAYALCNLSSSAASGCSFSQVHGLYCHFILASHHNLLLSLTSTRQCDRLQLEFCSALSFCVITLALWPSSSSLLQPQGWHGDLPACFSSKLQSVLTSWPS